MPDAYMKINNACLVIIASIAITAALSYTSPVLVPFAFSVFTYAVVAPLIRWIQEKWKAPKIVAVIITFIGILVVFAGLGLLIAFSIDGFLESTDQYRAKIEEFLLWIVEIGNNVGVPVDGSEVTQKIRELPFLTIAKNLTGGIFSFFGSFTLVLIFTLFLVSGGSISQSSKPMLAEINAKVSRYLATKLFTSVVTGIIVGIILSIFSVDLALMFAILTIILNFIPSIGSIISTLLPLPVVLLQFGFGLDFILILALTGATQFTIGNIVEPKMLGQKMDLHPVAVLMFLIFWGIVWGIPGMFLATPITAILKIVFSKIETTKPWSELLAGRF